MPINCVDGEVTDLELAIWEVTCPPTRIALRCDEVRAVFVGTPLARGIALLGLTRAQLWKLFPTKSRRKNAWTLLSWARRISGNDARRLLSGASWHQLRAAAAHDDEDAQIWAAVAWKLGIRR
jgi:hypothetical protein